MRRTTLSAVLISLLAAAGLAQQPQPLPPAVVPAAGATPVPAAEAPIARFEPLAAFPAPTQQALRGVASGANWLVRMNQAQGRFVHGVRPAVRQPMEGDNDLRQAFAALALAQGAKFTGDARSAAVASQSILTLLAATRIDPADPTCRVPTAVGCNPAALAAVLATAIYDLPGADDRLIAEAERLCNFVRKHPHQFRAESADAGLLLSALVAGNKARPEAWKVEAVVKALTAGGPGYRELRNADHISCLIPAFADLYLQTRQPDAATIVFELSDRLCEMQYPPANASNPTWGGGFPCVQPGGIGPTFESAACLAALGWAYQVTARNADVARAARYRQAAQDAAQFVTALQYTEPSTRHFEDTFRVNVLIGGFHLTPADGDLRIDATGRCVSGLVRYLASGAER